MYSAFFSLLQKLLSRGGTLKAFEIVLLPLTLTIGFIGYKLEGLISQEKDLDSRKSVIETREEKEYHKLTSK
jgi:hypothetical protein